ncbi:MAG: Sjogren's syndrome/scleroderma autoantigen 1 family protein [Candidatus Hodarchaeales archaeon]
MPTNKNDSTSEIKQMSSLLLSGAIMLADSCPDCKVPLFKKNEKIFCPKCGRKAIFASSDDEVRKLEQNQSISETHSAIKDIINGKLNFFTQKLASSEDFEEMKTIIQLMDLLLDLLKKITSI